MAAGRIPTRYAWVQQGERNSRDTWKFRWGGRDESPLMGTSVSLLCKERSGATVELEGDGSRPVHSRKASSRREKVLNVKGTR